MKAKGFYQYLVGGIFLSFGIYQMFLNELWEFALYSLAGAAFISVGMIKDNPYKQYHKLLSILSWILIIAVGILFLFMLRTDSAG